MSNFFSYIMARKSYIQWDHENIHFVLIRPKPQLYIYNASTLKQQSAGRHVAPLRHIILIAGQPVFTVGPFLK